MLRGNLPPPFALHQQQHFHGPAGLGTVLDRLRRYRRDRDVAEDADIVPGTISWSDRSDVRERPRYAKGLVAELSHMVKRGA